jgi:hypothetical protein
MPVLLPIPTSLIRNKAMLVSVTVFGSCDATDSVTITATHTVSLGACLSTRQLSVSQEYTAATKDNWLCAFTA